MSEQVFYTDTNVKIRNIELYYLSNLELESL